MHLRILFYLFLLLLLFPVLVNAQQSNRVVQEQCATMDRLEMQLLRNPRLKEKLEQERISFARAVNRGAYRQAATDDGAGNRTAFVIPVVFHIVTANPASISDATIQAQLDILNKSFAGTNADSARIPAWFKPFFGKSSVQFCLAQRTPKGEGTSGIERIKTAQTSFTADNDGVKHASTGGADSWDPKMYYNVWVCPLSNNILGYATFPADTGTPDEQGVVIDYRSLPGGSLANYNTGKTLPHETGHYLNLYHIWGDDKGDCSGTDDVADTPNQADATKGCTSGVKTDACTPGGNGIMYQNYMDYSYDSCMVMFTLQQVIRMESALVAYRASLLTSNGCTPAIVKNYDARLASIDQPAKRLCSSTFTPIVSISNKGSQLLTSLIINARIDNGSVTSYEWTGSLPYLSNTVVSLNNLTTTAGEHTLTIYVSSPDNKADEDATNDTVSSVIQFYSPATALSEGFEGNAFPPAGWDIVNPDNYTTWKKVTGVSKTGSASLMIDNFNYNSVGATDDIRLPTVTLQRVDSAFLSFQVAAAAYTDANTTNNVWDTLQVLASIDCGQTYTSIYKKYGKDLVTKATSTTTAFTPTASEWRKDSINLAGFIGQGNVLLSFRNITGYENNLYLDDINVRTVVVNPNLKKSGFLITPNPTSGAVTVQFYPQPNNLRAVQVYSLAGQKLTEVAVAEGQANNSYRIDLSRYAAGTYMIRAVFTDRVVIHKILKY